MNKNIDIYLWLGLILISIFMPSATSTAQDHPSKAPLAAMQPLSPLLGEWHMTTRYTPDGGVTWQETPAARVEITSRQKNLLLAEIPKETHKPGFHLETYITYDQYRRIYRLAAIDDTWGLMDIYEGTLEDNKLVLTNLRSGTFFPVEQDVWRAFRLTFELQPQERHMIVERSDDGGKSWQPAFELRYVAVS